VGTFVENHTTAVIVGTILVIGGIACVVVSGGACILAIVGGFDAAGLSGAAFACATTGICAATGAAAFCAATFCPDDPELGGGRGGGGCLSGGLSFTADTAVVTASGEQVPISSLKQGMKIEAHNTATGKNETQTVEAVYLNHDTDLYDLAITSTNGAAVSHTTSNHPFWDKTQSKWIEAANLRPGDQLLTANGTTATVIGGTTPANKTGWMWDLTISNDHDFYVVAGDTPVLVHNCTTPPGVRAQFNKMRPGVWKNEAAQNSGAYSPEDLLRMQQGKAPIGEDGFPMEIHHQIPLSQGGTNDPSNFVFLTRTDHRLGENYLLNHPPCNCG
jgi:hypothetical protein